MVSPYRSFVLVTLLTLSNQLLASTIGLQGQFRVNESGAATYTLPIDTPTARGGIKPDISIGYNSSLKTGRLGVGVALNAGSVITRCPQSYSTDNQLVGVDLTVSDRFCLDGQRLILTSGTYGSPWSTYRKEIDDYSLVTALGQVQGGGPSAFKVETKDGDVHYYGEQSSFDSQDLYLSAPQSSYDHRAIFPVQTDSGEVALNWGIKATVDPFGNYISYQYYLDEILGEHYLSGISYGGHVSSADSKPYRQVIFNYKNNPKSISGYVAGRNIAMASLLDSIAIQVDGVTQYKYIFQYQSSNVIEEKTYLLNIKKCVASSQQSCSTQVQFDWTKPAAKPESKTKEVIDERTGELVTIVDSDALYVPFKSQIMTNLPTSNSSSTQFFDIDGDGKGEMIFAEQSNWVMVDLDTGYKKALSHVGVRKNQYARTINYDGDGQRDLLVANSSNSDWYVITLKPSTVSSEICEVEASGGTLCLPLKRNVTYSEVPLNRKATGLEKGVVVADQDGDGLEDIIFFDGLNLNWYRNLGGYFAPASTLFTFSENEEPSFDKDVANAAANLKTTAAFDSNGDGRTDLLVKVSTRGAYCKVGNSNIPSTVVGSYSECVGDLGGVWREYTTHTYKLLVAEGRAYSDKGNLFGASEDSFVRIADVNGDGLVDILYPSSNRWYAKLATGVGYTESIDTGIATSVDKRLQTIFVDLNHDGRSDILTPTGASRYSIYMSHPIGSKDGVYWQSRGSLDIPQGAPIQFADTYGNGSLDLYVYKNSRWHLALANTNKFDHTVHTITDGYGAVTQIEYSKLTTEVNGEPEVYKAQYSSAESSKGNLSFVAPISVVKSVSTHVGDVDRVSIDYEYGGFAMNRLGRGILGFELLRTIDRQSGVISETIYHQTFPLIGTPKATLQTKDGQIIKHSKNVYDVRSSVDATDSKQVTLGSVEDITNQVGSNGALYSVSRVLSEYTYDGFGNAEIIDVSVFEGSQGTLVSQTTTVNEYLGEGGGVEKGRLSKTTVSKSRFGQRETVPTLSRTSVFSYALGHSKIPDGVLVSSTVEPSNSHYKTMTQYAYDKYGNNTQTNVTAATTLNGGGAQTRTLHKYFGENGRYLHSETNSLGETKRYFYNEQTADQVKGIITRVRVEDANKRSAITITDLWGRTKQTLSPDGVTTHYDYKKCSITGCNNVRDAYMVSTVTREGSPIAREYIDKFGRRIANQKQGFTANQWITTSVEYDNQGRINKRLEPSYLEKSPYYTQVIYDEFSRLTSQVNPDGSAAYSYYYGLETLAQDTLGHQTTSFKNALGEVVRVNDNRSNSLDYVYDAYGNLIKVYISGNGRELLRTSSTYDSLGRKIATQDLDQGKWSYEYNAFGELKRQTNANGLSTEFEYDILGRQVRRWDEGGTSCWIYGSPASKEAGLLIETRQYSDPNQICSAPNFQHRIQYHYDGKGRKEHVYTYVGNERHQVSYVYDSQGRIIEVIYPDRELSVRHKYNNQGYLFKLEDKASGKPYQTIESMDARGQITNVKYGNGVSQTSGFDLDTGRINNIQLNKGGLLHELNYQFDSQGNLTWRDIKLSSATVSYQEDYGYDDLYRMETRKITISSGAAKLPSEYRQYQKLSYDDFGNITFKSGVGTYNYDSQNPFKLLDICSDGVCNITESKPASKSCASGYQLSGTNCIKNEAKVAEKSYSYSCQAGYSRSGSSCRKTENKNAKSIVTESCPAGYAEPNCEKTEIVMSPRMPTHPGYRCTGGEPAGWGGNRIWECTVSAAKVKETSYQCDTGWSLSGTLCSRTVTKNATKHTHYSCSAGWSLSGSSCKRTLVKPINYSCSASWSLTGSNCTRVKKATYSFDYDRNGNVTSDGARTFTYNAFNKVSRISKGSEYSTFSYDAERRRYTRLDQKLENGKLTHYSTTYVGGLYEKVVRTGGGKSNLTEHKFYVGNAVITKRSNSSSDIFYLHKDHQGSTTSITNKSGTVVQQFIYDPWGKQTAAFENNVFGTYVSPAKSKGYTGHEHVSHLDIIHMNGRIYDPTLGRFLQADPHIQAPKNSQSYNRYSYVLNNPLSYTDPSGYFFKKLFKKLNKALGKFAPFAGLALMLIPGVGQWAAATWYNAAAIGFVSGGVATGSLRGALIGAFSGAAFQQIGGAFDAKSGFFAEGGIGHIGTHAVTGGIISELSGGKFGHGFFAAGLTKAFNINKMIGTAAKDAGLRVVTAAVVGGTISRVTGGKFANGAITAGFAQALNGEQQAKRAEAQKRKMYLVAMHDSHPESTPGHTFVGFVDADGKASAFGFYPDTEKFGTWDMLVENENMSGYIKDDTALFKEALSGNEYYSMKVFTVDQTTYDNAMNYINGYATNNDYGLFTNSCVHAAFGTFNNAGLINSTGSPAAVLPRTIYKGISNGY